MKTLSLLAVAILGWYAYHRLHAPLTYPPGVLIAADPSQTAVGAEATPFPSGKFRLRPLAHFALAARVLHCKIYRYDRAAELVPVDLAVGWGAMSDQAVLNQLEISQASRFFYYEYQRQPPIPPNEIISHATNLHLIPASETIADRCKSLQTGELIHLSGLLVEASGPGISGTWRSSLSRTDSGNGACELVWVEEIGPLVR